MPENPKVVCPELESIQQRLQSAQSRRAQYTYTQNKHLWGVSAAKAARIAKDESKLVVDLQNQKFAHQRTCDVCKVGSGSN